MLLFDDDDMTYLNFDNMFVEQMNSKLEWSSAFQENKSSRKCINSCLILIYKAYLNGS